MPVTYNLNLVGLSVIIAILSAYTALDLTDRIATAKRRASLGWLMAGAGCLGIGIWAMHFVGMLAFNLPVSVSYNGWIVMASIFPAILASGIVLWIASRPSLPTANLVVAGLLMGIGITAMHYLGMAAMQLPAIAHYDPRLVALSAAIAVVVSFVALWLSHALRNQPVVIWWQKIGAAMVMGIAVPMMHYTGMAAVCFTAIAAPSGDFPAPNTTWLASLTCAMAFSLLGLALVTSSETKVSDRTKALSEALLQLQQSQLQLVQTEKMSSLGQMVAGVAHEINNPINFINGNIVHVYHYTQDLLTVVQAYEAHYPVPPQSLQDILADKELDFLQQDLAKLLESMQVGSNRIREIVLSLRNFSRLDESAFKAVNLHEGIDNTLMILQHRLKASPDRATIEVIKQYGSLPLVECYAGQLNQVLMNLLANAIDALEDAAQRQSSESAIKLSPTIRIATQIVREDWVQIVIADDGPGMPESVRSHIFDPFFTTKPVGKGTGLGLSISYQIVTEKHGGKIWCDSAPGAGTQFVIEIPIQQLASPLPAAVSRPELVPKLVPVA
jgi:signal transduction histidine kinase